MSIASEITRLQTAKADIKTSIENKGVTVPSNASIDTYDTYIDQIQTGGGGSTNYLVQYANRSLSGVIGSTQIGTNIGKNMPSYLFCDQNNITEVDLTGTGVTKISDAFCVNCTKLVNVNIPNIITEIGHNVCVNCTKLVNITIPNTVTTIGDRFCQNSGITSFTIPSSVTTIGHYFLQNTPITSITIPSTVTSLYNDAFNGCRSLTTLIFNAPINPNQAFCKETDSLALVDLNSSVTSIRNYSFSAYSESTNLLEVVLRRTDGIVTVANKIGSMNYSAAFRNRRNIKLYVPSALIASYEADTNWAAGITAGYLTIVALEGSQYE